MTLPDLEKDLMAGRSELRGHPLIWAGDRKTGKWVYEDTGEDIPANRGKVRPCVKCGKLWPIDGGPDPCLGNLPGVDNACCGHGNPERAYIRFKNGVVIGGFDVIEYTVLWHADNIVSELSKQYGISEKLLLSRSRKQEVVRVRKMAMRRMRTELNMTFWEIGRMFKRGHSVIMYHLQEK